MFSRRPYYLIIYAYYKKNHLKHYQNNWAMIWVEMLCCLDCFSCSSESLLQAGKTHSSEDLCCKITSATMTLFFPICSQLSIYIVNNLDLRVKWIGIKSCFHRCNLLFGLVSFGVAVRPVSSITLLLHFLATTGAFCISVMVMWRDLRQPPARGKTSLWSRILLKVGSLLPHVPSAAVSVPSEHQRRRPRTSWHIYCPAAPDRPDTCVLNSTFRHGADRELRLLALRSVAVGNVGAEWR